MPNIIITTAAALSLALPGAALAQGPVTDAFTGLDLALVAGGGLLLLVMGAGLRRLARSET